MQLRRIVDVVAGVVLVIVASAGYHRVFEGWTFLFRFCAAAIVGAALVALLTRGLVPRPWAIAALVVAVVPVEMYVALSDTLVAGLPTGDTVSAMWEGFTSGWADALDDFLPLADPSPVTVLLVALVYAASVLTTVLILHTDRVVPVVLPTLVLYGLSLPLGAPASQTGLVLSGLLTIAALVLVLLRANPPGRGPKTGVVRADADFQPQRNTGRVVLIGGPMILAAAVSGVLIAAVAGLGRTDEPFDPRDRRAERVADESVVNPLDQFKTVQAQDPPVVAFELTLLGSTEISRIDRVTLAVLDSYDGRVWSTTDRFERYDEDLPIDESLADSHDRLTVSFDRLADDLEVYLPVVGRPAQIVDEAVVQFGTDSGTVLMPESGFSQPLVMAVDHHRADVARLVPESAGEFDDQRLLPSELPTSITDLAAEVTAGIPDPGDQLDAIRTFLETETRFDSDAASGHSAGQIERFVAGEIAGNDVHYATAVALMARSLGFPSRLVVGWQLPETDEGAASAELTSADYRVWSEVRAAGLGWQAVPITGFDAGEPVEDVPGTTVPSGELGGGRQTPERASPGQLLPEATEEEASLSPWLVPMAVALFAGAWVLAFGLLIVLAKRRRRRHRRRAPTPSERLMGAWDDSGDRLVETGVGVRPELTFTETVEAGSVRLGDDTVAALRDMLPEVGACAYSDTAPAADAADRAWELADSFRKDLGGSRSVVRSAVAGLDPRPLLRTRGR